MNSPENIQNVRKIRKIIFKLFPANTGEHFIPEKFVEELPVNFRIYLKELKEDLVELFCLENENLLQGESEKIKNDLSLSLSRIGVLLDYTWERLNMGHWKNVPRVWRIFYTCLSLFKVGFLSFEKDFKLKDLIKECDMGLLMGEPIYDNILSKLACELHKFQNNIEDFHPFSPVPENKNKKIQNFHFPNQSDTDGKFMTEISEKPSLQTFMEKYLSKETPVILTRVIDHWPASQKWDVNYIKTKAGSRLVPVEIGSKYTAEDWTQKLLTIGEFIETFMEKLENNTEKGEEPRPKGYLAQHQLFQQIPELMEDIRIPEYCFLGESPDTPDINAWFGPSKTVSPIHFDPKHNLLTQVFGEKFIRLFPPSESSNLYAYDANSIISNTSQIELEDAFVFEKYPRLKNAKYTDIVLEKGQILYIPQKWWHYVQSLSPSFSVSFWFE